VPRIAAVPAGRAGKVERKTVRRKTRVNVLRILPFYQSYRAGTVRPIKLLLPFVLGPLRELEALFEELDFQFLPRRGGRKDAGHAT
jgi:hypothetical protein